MPNNVCGETRPNSQLRKLDVRLHHTGNGTHWGATGIRGGVLRETWLHFVIMQNLPRLNRVMIATFGGRK